MPDRSRVLYDGRNRHSCDRQGTQSTTSRLSPVQSRRVPYHQSGDADGRGGREQAVQEGSAFRLPAGEGERKQQRSGQNQRDKAKGNGLKRGQPEIAE